MIGRTAGHDGFALQTAGKVFPLWFGGHLQADGKTFYDPNGSHLLPRYGETRCRV